MPRKHTKARQSLEERFPPSEPCSCTVCLAYCQRPGWWTVSEASAAIEAGFADRMMLELSLEKTFGVLSPAFRGCEGLFALQEFQANGCTFLQKGLCELHGSGHMPLECRFCHHNRAGQGLDCHAALEKDWNTPAGQELVTRWQRITRFWKRKSNLWMRKILNNSI